MGKKSMGPVEEKIESKLKAQFTPVHLEVVNESYKHNVPPGSESHFKVTLVSEAFVGKRSVQRHQAIYGTLRDELNADVHALALHTYAPDEWQPADAAPDSPPCLGGGQ